MPISLDPKQGKPEEAEWCVYVLILPRQAPLGNSEDDFSSVRIMCFDGSEMKEADAGDVFICGRGKLGTLPRGLLYIEDYKRKVEKIQIAEKHVDSVVEHLQSKRMHL